MVKTNLGWMNLSMARFLGLHGKKIFLVPWKYKKLDTIC